MLKSILIGMYESIDLLWTSTIRLISLSLTRKSPTLYKISAISTAFEFNINFQWAKRAFRWQPRMGLGQMGLRRICNFNIRRRLDEKIYRCKNRITKLSLDHLWWAIDDHLVGQNWRKWLMTKMKSCYFKSAIEVLEQIRAYLFQRQ